MSVRADESVGLVLLGGDPHENPGAMIAGFAEAPSAGRDAFLAQLIRENGAVRALLKLKTNKVFNKEGSFCIPVL